MWRCATRGTASSATARRHQARKILMTIIEVVSPDQLAHRRQKLRQARRLKILQTLWRTVAVSGIAGGVVWAIAQPGWVIRQPEQVEIAGNKLLSRSTIHKALPIDYPQSLFRLQPQEITLWLSAKAPIARATVSRHLLPPRLIIEVLEREPVAIAVKEAGQPKMLGLLDSQGVLMPKDSYTNVNGSFPLPNLTVIGSPEQYQPHWEAVYQAISRCSVKILTIDWQNPRNIILNTEIGIVHVGSMSTQFATQILTLAQMQQLPAQINYSQIAYIDLTNPASSSIQMKLDTVK